MHVAHQVPDLELKVRSRQASMESELGMEEGGIIRHLSVQSDVSNPMQCSPLPSPGMQQQQQYAMQPPSPVASIHSQSPQQQQFAAPAPPSLPQTARILTITPPPPSVVSATILTITPPSVSAHSVNAKDENAASEKDTAEGTE